MIVQIRGIKLDFFDIWDFFVELIVLGEYNLSRSWQPLPRSSVNNQLCKEVKI